MKSMPNNDIEEFLKRAAQRRQAKTPQVPAPAPVSTPRPEYTSAKTERIPRAKQDDTPVQAILLEDDEVIESVARHLKGLDTQRAAKTREANQRRAGGTVKPVEPAQGAASREVVYEAPKRAPSVAPQTIVGDNAGFTVADRLVTMLQKPEGMMQAMLLNEILKRPEERW
jgi:hypothetical protein